MELKSIKIELSECNKMHKQSVLMDIEDKEKNEK
jgi:hypothetical protein